MTETQLTEQIRRLAEEVPASPTSVENDLARGRSRLRRRRTALAGGALAVAVAGGATWSVVDHDGPRHAEPAVDVAQPPPAGVPEDLSGDLAARVRDLAGRVRTREDELPLITLRQLQDVSDILRDRLSGHVGWLAVGAAPSWRALGADTCPSGWTCEDVQVRGADRSRWAESGSVHQLAVDFDGRVHLFTASASDTRPSEVAWGDGRP